MTLLIIVLNRQWKLCIKATSHSSCVATVSQFAFYMKKKNKLCLPSTKIVAVPDQNSNKFFFFFFFFFFVLVEV